MHSAQPLPSLPPALLCSAPPGRRTPLHILPAAGLLVAFGLGKDGGLPGPTPRLTQGVGRGPELSFPGHSPTVSSPAISAVPFSRGKELGTGKGRGPYLEGGVVLPVALSPQGSMDLTLCTEAPWAALPFLPGELESRMGGCAHHRTPRVSKSLIWRGEPATSRKALFQFAIIKSSSGLPKIVSQVTESKCLQRWFGS